MKIKALLLMIMVCLCSCNMSKAQEPVLEDSVLNEKLQAILDEQRKIEDMDGDYKSFLKSKIIENKDNEISYVLVNSLLKEKDIDVPLLCEIFAIDGKFAKDRYYAEVKYYLNSMKPVYDLVGTQFKDVEMVNYLGIKCKLSHYVGKGKYVLIDFWASWCQPCMKEMPNVKTMYEKYKSKKFNVVGISLDNDESSWKAAVKNNDLSWTHLTDLNGWNSSAADMYHVKSIPQNFLCDPTGKIIAVNLVGNKLRYKLEELFEPSAE